MRPPNRRVARSLLLAVSTTIALGGCASLNYEDGATRDGATTAQPVEAPVPRPAVGEFPAAPEPPAPQGATDELLSATGAAVRETERDGESATDAEPAAKETPSLIQPAPVAATDEAPLRWSDLTRLAREHQQGGEYDEANQRLAQASMLVSDLPPAHARRRTVFGLRARLAMEFERRGEFERADALADTLIAEADAHPEIGRDALVGLALAQADRRYAKDDGQELPERDAQRLHVLHVAMRTAAEGSANRARMDLANRVIVEARLQNDLDLARRAVEIAVSDAQKLASSHRADLAWLLLQRAEIAAAQGDFAVAEADAIRANQILEKAESSSSARALAEGTLAGILGLASDTERAETILRGANARDEIEAPLHASARRVLLGARARIDRALGKRALARDSYRRAIDLPELDSTADQLVRAALRIELKDLSETLEQ